MDAVSSPEKLEVALRAMRRLPLPSRAWRAEIEPWRVLFSSDREDRVTRVSVGAAVFVLTLALRAQGCAARVELLPRPGLLAVVRFSGRRPPLQGDRRLAAALDHLDGHRTLTDATRRMLERAAAVEGVRLRFVDDHRATQAVLSTRRDDAFAQLVTGLALARVMVTAASLGIRVRWSGDVTPGTPAVLAFDQAATEQRVSP